MSKRTRLYGAAPRFPCGLATPCAAVLLAVALAVPGACAVDAPDSELEPDELFPAEPMLQPPPALPSPAREDALARRVRGELAARRAPRLRAPAMLTPAQMRAAGVREPRPGNATRRQMIWNVNYPNDFNQWAGGYAALDMMRQLVYATRLRVRALDAVVDKNRDNVRFRMGFMIATLEDLLLDLRIFYTHIRNTNQTRWTKKAVLYFIVYYSHALKKYVDIVYLVERAARYYDEYMQYRASRLKPARLQRDPRRPR